MFSDEVTPKQSNGSKPKFCAKDEQCRGRDICLKLIPFLPG